MQKYTWKMASNSLKNPGILWLRKSGNPVIMMSPGCQMKTLKTFIFMVKPLFFSEKPLFYMTNLYFQEKPFFSISAV